MTKLYEDLDAMMNDHPHKKGLRNFTWTNDAIRGLGRYLASALASWLQMGVAEL